MFGGIRVALYAGLIAAAEAVIVLTSVGYIDYHVFESFRTTVALWRWLPVLKDGDVTGRRAVRTVLSGAAVGPGETVSIAARVRTDAGREFEYLDTVKADEKGNFECRLPYAQGKQAFSDVSATTPYRVTIRGQEFRVVANEQDVLQGRPARQEQ